MGQPQRRSLKDQDDLCNEIEIEELYEGLQRLKGKTVYFDQEIQSFQSNFAPDVENLVHFAQKALQSLAGTQKSRQELERTFSYLNELHLIAQTLDGRLHSTEFFIKSCLVIQ